MAVLVASAGMPPAAPRGLRRRRGAGGPALLAALGAAVAAAAALGGGEAFSLFGLRSRGAHTASPTEAAVDAAAARGLRSARRSSEASSPEAMEAEELSGVKLPAQDTPGAAAAQVMPGVGEEKVAIVTGASTGIGLATVEGMAKSGRYRKIVLAGRDKGKHDAAISGLKLRVDPALEVEFEYAPLDLASLASVREFAQRFIDSHQSLDTLILNAGVMAVPERRTTEEGHEYQFGVNHLGHFLLANLLIDTMVQSSMASDPGRVIVLSSSAHGMPSPLSRGDLSALESESYQPWIAYGQSKLANLLFAYELDRRCRQRGLPISANAVHPGMVETELWRYMAPDGGEVGEHLRGLARPLLGQVVKTSEQGARTSVLLATGPEGKMSGRYWQDEQPSPSTNIDPWGMLPERVQDALPNFLKQKVSTYDPSTWAALWRESEKMVDLRPGEAASLAEQ